MRRYAGTALWTVLACSCAAGTPQYTAHLARGDERVASRRYADARRAYDEAGTRAPDANARSRALGRRTLTFVYEGRLDDARGSLAAELAAAQREQMHDHEIGALLRSAWVELELGGDPAAADRHLGAMLALAAASDAPAERREHLRAAALTVRVRALAAQGSIDAARALGAEVRRGSTERAHDGELGVLDAVLMWTETRAGRIDTALAYAKSALPEFPLTWAYEAEVRELAGEHDAAARLRQQIADAREIEFFHALAHGRAVALGGSSRGGVRDAPR